MFRAVCMHALSDKELLRFSAVVLKLVACLTLHALDQAFGPRPPGGLPIETQENTGFIKKVAEKLHMRSRESDHHPQHRRTEACAGD